MNKWPARTGTLTSRLIKNSGAQIAKAKIMLHESYCIKNLYRCKQCGQAVEKKSKEAHDLEFHTPVPCPHCSAPQEKTKLESHVQTCPKRPKTCEFCEIEFPADKYRDHIAVCGSKTRQCPKCEKYIPRRDWNAHQTINCEPVRLPIPKEPVIPECNKPAVMKSVVPINNTKLFVLLSEYVSNHTIEKGISSASGCSYSK